MSSSSESEDENLKMLAEAVDIKLFDNSLFGVKDNNNCENKEKPKNELKSQRYVEVEDNIFHSELNVSESMQKHIGTKLSKIIEDSVEYVDVKKKRSKKAKEDTDDDCLKLLNGYDETIKIDQEEIEVINQKQVPIKRRIVEQDHYDEATKIKLSATDDEKLSRELSLWDKKNKHDSIDYKRASKETYHLVEKPNDYTKIRLKNQWNESKIKFARNFGKSLKKCITE